MSRSTPWEMAQRLPSTCLFFSVIVVSTVSGQRLEYRSPPVDNPLKGFVPYASPENHRFPHSLEFRYFALGDVLVGEATNGDFEFDWSRVEDFLNEVKSRGCQAVFRIHCEYPQEAAASKVEIPKFLVGRGVEVTRIRSTEDVDSNGSPTHFSMSPDYENPLLRRALVQMIRALGARYDGDPRIGFLEVGIFGFWGEWHTYPDMEHMASRGVQDEVLEAFEHSFQTTKLLVRYPEDGSRERFAPNVNRNVGHHDDSFTWSTLYNRDGGWYFLTQMAENNALGKWKTNPIGGELYPQLNSSVFKNVSEHGGRVASEFVQTVEATHATYVRLWAVFEEGLSDPRRCRAESAVLRMGYDLHFRRATITCERSRFRIRAELENRGVAPFYYNWPVYLGLLNSAGEVIEERLVDWHVHKLPAGARRILDTTFAPCSVPAGGSFAVRVPNPMDGGRPLRFSNKSQQLDGQTWMVLGKAAADLKATKKSRPVPLLPNTTRRLNEGKPVDLNSPLPLKKCGGAKLHSSRKCMRTDGTPRFVARHIQ